MTPQPARPAPISASHPLRHLFQDLTEASFEHVGHTDPELTVYVTGLLVDFTHIDNLYRVRDGKGQRLEYLVDFQMESQRGDKAHARATQKHLGDYALFIVGMFPESLQQHRRPISAEYYVAQGKHAYSTVSSMDGMRPTAALFRKLAANFETCVCALNIEKDWLQDEFYTYMMRQVFA
jgi:hypothetical protein